MILDKLVNASAYLGTSPGLAAALEYLKNDFSRMTPGRYDLDGDNLFALVQHRDTQPKEKGVWEAHRKYADVQYVFEGAEQMGYANVDDLRVSAEYDGSKDALFLQGNGCFFPVRAGSFAVFWPQDAHMPCVAIGKPKPVKKLVVKIRLT